MYVCLCNAFNDGAVDRVIAEGAATVAQVYRGLGVAPRCGKCKDMIRERLDARRAGQTAMMAAAGAAAIATAAGTMAFGGDD